MTLVKRDKIINLRPDYLESICFGTSHSFVHHPQRLRVLSRKKGQKHKSEEGRRGQGGLLTSRYDIAADHTAAAITCTKEAQKCLYK